LESPANLTRRKAGVSQGVRSVVSQPTSALPPLMIGVSVQETGAFVGPFVVLPAAVAVSAACMIKLAPEGY